ncbi:PREDICTED: probable ATP-dependent DNA helicase HFM1 isoform X3 [Crocodylus porosus]|uniref:probable ATP-dependent DNA helicase HFM1 isoform X3 n=1 Tax=Crocodylus porosus TaxID=8502 RepID=UPI0009393ADF|nr:PREDICTED: probable ATP-dependent DNA helicase HFM1 isoform X3 [Crocodylus porosus]
MQVLQYSDFNLHSVNDVFSACENEKGVKVQSFLHGSETSDVEGAVVKKMEVLRAVTEVPPPFRNIFKDFPYFNYIQSKALDDLLYTDRNFVICAPTGSGKTVMFELAITRLLMEVPMPWLNIKIVYMAPIKALCSQRFDDWKEKFGPIGLSCKELTGDTVVDDLFEIQHAHIIMTTPEKWDSMTRKWRDNSLVQLVRLFLIDEVHVVKDESRGATLEVVVSRMKTVQSSVSRSSENPNTFPSMRFVAVSATIPNAEDIAEWLTDGKKPAVCLKIDENHRPVKLRKVVLGFPCSGNQTEFKFDLTLNYKIASVIQTYSEQKPALVFCATRKGVQQAASVFAKDAKFIMTTEQKQRLQRSANSIKDSKLRDLLIYGVAYHHAGMELSDRKIIEGAFTVGDLPVLFTTSTLAMGVNLPAHLVVIKSTMHYVGGMFQEYSETDILQMIGRAGRPQFDTTATAVIMTRLSTREKYVQMLNGADTIESSLHKHLVEHLNAEIVLHTITNVNIALEWIRSTFLYIRALKNAVHYGFSPGLDRVGIEAKLQDLSLKNVNDLASHDLIKMDEKLNFRPTENGKLMAWYYIAFDTVKQFSTIKGTETLSELVTKISSCTEFSDIKLRTSEKKILNALNKDKNRITIRFPMEGKIKTTEMKVNCLIQAQLGCIPIQDFTLTQDIGKIFRTGIRVTKWLSDFLASQRNSFSALLNSLILAKCFRCKLWENSLHVSKQLEKIGSTCNQEVSYTRSGNRECNHHCKNKDACGHDCCKIGVSQKSELKRDSKFSSYLSDLRNRSSISSVPPVKRLKMQLLNQTQNVDLKQFVYTPKSLLPALPRSEYVESPASSVDQCENVDNLGRFEKQVQQESYEKINLSWKHSSNVGEKTHQAMMSNKNLESSMPNLTDADRSSSWFSKALNVNFELGDEVWDDFDDEKLIYACSFSSDVANKDLGSGSSCLQNTTQHKPLFQNTQYEVISDTSGNVDKLQDKMGVHPQNSLSPTLNAPSKMKLPTQNKNTNEFSFQAKKHPNPSEVKKTFCSSNSGTVSESSKSSEKGDFFICNKERKSEIDLRYLPDDEANDAKPFLGIFDGIF